MFRRVAPSTSVAWMQTIAEISQPEWDALAVPLKTPFLEWEWLNNLETSGSATVENGWQPCHLTLWRDRQLIAAAPLYLKTHSYGEFVFDHQWADVSHRMGIPYYPKLLGMTPFTPAVGYRFLISPEEDEAQLTAVMVAAIEQFCDRNQIASCNFLFVDPDWRPLLEAHGFSGWLHHSYVWQNHHFASFADYLQQFNANQRRNIKRERKAIAQAGLTVQTLAGEGIPDALFRQIYPFYSSTCDKFYWGSKYLTQQFFEQLQPNYQHRVVLMVAHTGQEPCQPLGLSFCIRKGDRLYGRYWGCLEEIHCLHFEACYYQPIDWSITQGIQLFDPGAGGSHKKRRGFPATANHSLHRFFDRRMNHLLRSYIDDINAMEQEEIEAINHNLPFSKREIHLPASSRSSFPV